MTPDEELELEQAMKDFEDSILGEWLSPPLNPNLEMWGTCQTCKMKVRMDVPSWVVACGMTKCPYGKEN